MAAIRLLITRPEDRGDALLTAATAAGLYACCLPLQEIVAGADVLAAIQALNQASPNALIIATSQYAISAVSSHKSPLHWPKCDYLAVGKATAERWRLSGVQADYPQQADSEGLLAMPQCAHLKGREVILLKGHGGRELLADTLQQQAADLAIFEVYRRQTSANLGKLKQLIVDQKINTLLATSGELVTLIGNQLSSDPSLKQQITLLVPSERVKEIAQSLNFTSIINIKSAGNDAVMRVLSELTHTGNAHGRRK
jgi:uroporphyrinogen-III synthase